MRRKNDIPAGIACHHPCQHFLIAFIGRIAEPDTVLPLEPYEHRRIDVRRPVKYVQTRAPVARTCGERCCTKTEMTPVHRVSSLWASRIIAPNATTISAETA